MMLPPGWAEIKLGQLGRWVGGGTPSKARPEYWAGGKIPWVSPKDMKVDVIRSAQDCITDLAVRHSATSVVPAGSVLMVVRSGILQHSFPVALSAVDVTLNQDMKGLTPANGVDGRYVSWALRRYEREILNTCSKAGTTVQSIEFPSLLDFSIPLPPTSEQRRIVAAIEEHMSRLDAATDSLARVRLQIPHYKRAILQKNVGGLGAHRSVSRWPTYPLGEFLADIESGKNFKCEERPPVDGELGVVKVSSVTWGEFDDDESKTVMDDRRVDTSLFVQPGDFLFSRANTIQLVGACVIVRNVRRRVMLSDKILRFKLKGLDLEWLLFVLRSPFGRSEIERLATGNQESMRNISQASIRQIRIPVPPRNERTEAVSEINLQMTLAQRTQGDLEQLQARSLQMRQAILHRAFSGNLVPQDPKDEPAANLLQRITSQKAGGPQTSVAGPTRRKKSTRVGLR